MSQVKPYKLVNGVLTPISDSDDVTFNSVTITGGGSGGVAVPGVYTAMQEPTGFADRTAVLSWSDINRTLTITGAHDVYVNGVKYSKTTDSIQIDDTTGLHHIYYSTSGVLSKSMTFPGFFVPYMASVYWNTTTDKGIVGEERHGITMDGTTHGYLHRSFGTRYISGYTLTVPTNSTFSMSSGSIADEDITISPSTTTTCDVFYKNGSTDYEWNAAQTALYGTSLRYNNVNALTAVTSGYFVALWVFASNSVSTINSPVAVIIGQRQDNTLALARTNNTYDSLVLGGLPTQEFKLLYRVIYQNNGGTPTYIETADYRSVSNAPAGTYVATAHSSLTGLSNDDHTQYALLGGRDVGQTFIGGGTTSGALTVVGGQQTTSTLTLKTTTGVGTTGADMIFQVGNNGATEGLRILNSGVLEIGGSGDTNLYRASANVLKTDDTFNAVTDLQKNGQPVARWRGVSSGAPGSDVLDGDLYYDSGDSKVYIRANSSWIALT